jgi:hypothetical protein
MTQPAARIGLLVLCIVSAGCGHSEPFGSQTYGTDQPFDATPPIQLTLNRGHDRRPAWLPDGSAILYSTQLEGSRDHDVCLADLPPTGGRQRALTCNLTPTGSTLTEAFESAAPAQDGRLVYVAATGATGALIPNLQELALATVKDPATYTSLAGIPYTIPGRRTHGGVSQIHWLSPTRLVFLGEAVNVFQPCLTCQMDTLHSGLDAVLLSVDGTAASLQAIPGTDNASGISAGGNEDEVYYTLGGDTRVYRQTLSTGAVAVVYDFGPGGIARDVDVVGDRIAAVVGGRVHFVEDPSFGTTQWDSGGIVHVVNLSSASDIVVTDPADSGLYRRPRISPAGSQIVVERYPLIFDSSVGGDTTVARTADLFLLNQP